MVDPGDILNLSRKIAYGCEVCGMGEGGCQG